MMLGYVGHYFLKNHMSESISREELRRLTRMAVEFTTLLSASVLICMGADENSGGGERLIIYLARTRPVTNLAVSAFIVPLNQMSHQSEHAL
jgi:hypothetical protein